MVNFHKILDPAVKFLRVQSSVFFVELNSNIAWERKRMGIIGRSEMDFFFTGSGFVELETLSGRDWGDESWKVNCVLLYIDSFIPLFSHPCKSRTEVERAVLEVRFSRCVSIVMFRTGSFFISFFSFSFFYFACLLGMCRIPIETGFWKFRDSRHFQDSWHLWGFWDFKGHFSIRFVDCWL